MTARRLAHRAHWSPVMVETMLRSYYLGDWVFKSSARPAYLEAAERLRRLGLVNEQGHATPRGEAHVEFILQAAARLA